jgi:hypothetical protein
MSSIFLCLRPPAAKAGGIASIENVFDVDPPDPLFGVWRIRTRQN